MACTELFVPRGMGKEVASGLCHFVPFGGLAVHGGGGGGMGMEAPAKKAPVAHPRTNWSSGIGAGQIFYGPAGGLDAGLPLGVLLPPLGGKGLGEAAALRAQVGVHPPVGIHFFGGVYDPGQEAS